MLFDILKLYICFYRVWYQKNVVGRGVFGVPFFASFLLVFQKDAFYLAKGILLHAKRPPFTA